MKLSDDQVLPVGLVLVLAVGALGWLRGAFDEPQPCIQVPAHAHQDAAGYWWAGTIGPYGWSEPGQDRCVVAVPATRGLVGPTAASRPGDGHTGADPGRQR